MTGMLAEARSSPSGLSPTVSTRRLRAIARARAGPALEGGEHRHPVTRAKRASSARSAGTTSGEGRWPAPSR